MNHGETSNLSTLGGSTKTSIAQHIPVMTHILAQNLQEFTTKWLHLLDMRYPLMERLDLSFEVFSFPMEVNVKTCSLFKDARLRIFELLAFESYSV